jgi:Leucine-rich repeat (LRR) protein
MKRSCFRIWSVFFLALVAILFSVNCAIAKIPQAEREALIALYNSTNGDNWTNKSGWKTAPLDVDGFAMPGTENTWYGITPNPGNTAIYTIQLANNNLIGSIPAELGNLTGLQSLFLWDNDLSGSITPELGNLNDLMYLYLDNNQLSGSIPVELGNLTSLQRLLLDDNHLNGSIPIELSNLTNLAYLSLSSNQLSGPIPAELGNLTNLTHLYLESNQLSGSIPIELCNLTNLLVFSFPYNQLTGPIPPELGNLPNLQTLYLAYNQLSGSIPTELSNLTNLAYLNLSCNQLTGSIPSQLGNLTKLTSIQLDYNQLTGSIPVDFSNLTNLQYLLLSRNQLTGPIPDQLGNLINLQWLQLDYNQLSGSIPSGLGNLTKLQYLWLSSNQLTDEIPTSLTNLSCLTNLNIRYNALYTDDATLLTFLNNKDSSWANTQTIAPTDVTVNSVSASSALIKWTPITYTSNTGGYIVYYSTSSGGPYDLFGVTTNKYANQMTVRGLESDTDYYFIVQTRTDSNSANQNTVYSEYSAETYAATTILDDTDGDNISDSWEIEYFLNLSRDGTEDYDNDDLLDFQEYETGTNPTNADTDGDGVIDGDEVSSGTSPNDPYVYPSGSISGIVITDSGETPIEGLWVYAVNYTTGDWGGSAYTEADGTYVITGLPIGSYWVSALPDEDYLREFYNDTYKLDSATEVPVTSGEITTNIDFSLATGGKITGIVTADSDGSPLNDKSVYFYNITTGSSASEWTNSEGIYSKTGLVPGTYRIDVSSSGNYAGEYYDNTYRSDLATPVSIGIGETVSGIDFGLALVGSISGFLTADADGSAIQGASIRAYDYQTGAFVNSTTTQSDGSYSITYLHPGSYRVLVYSSGNYAHEFYNNTYSYDSAASVSVTAGNITSGINFGLVQGGSISGTVYKNNGLTPIPSTRVYAYLKQCDSLPIGESWTNSSGIFILNGMPAGEIYVLASDVLYPPGAPPGPKYIGKWFDNKFDCDEAEGVNVTSGFQTANMNFSLDVDTDNDGLGDEWEIEYFSDLSHNGTADYDNDGLTDLQEYQNGTNPTLKDTDGDGMPDGWEVQHGLNPLVNDTSADPDGDGYTNLQEYNEGGDPSSSDTPFPWDLFYPVFTGK